METPRKVQGDVLAEVSFQLTFDDLVSSMSNFYGDGDLNARLHRESLHTILWALIGLGAPLILTIVAMYISIAPLSLTKGFGLLLLAVVWHSLLLVMTIYSMLPKQNRSNILSKIKESFRDMLKAGATSLDTGPQILRITSEGLIQSGRWGSSELLWRGGIIRVERNESLFLIVNLSRSYLIIPQRAFKTTEEAESFFALVSDLIAKNGGGNDLDLIEHLQHHDLPCPKCKYNLRGTTTSSCPECGKRLSLGMFHDSIK